MLLLVVVTRGQSYAHKPIITGTLTVLYAFIIVQAGIYWRYSSPIFCIEADAKASTFRENAIGIGSTTPSSITLVSYTLELVAFVLADALMMWRCFHACGRVLRKLAIPMGLLVVEFLLVLTDTAFVSLTYTRKSFQSDVRVHQSALISGVLEIVTVVTSLSTTFIICRHIYTYSSTSQDRHSRRRYRYIIDILVQSSALYTTSVLLGAISGFLDKGNVATSMKALILENYADTVAQIMTGLAPTLMVARLVFASDTKNNDTISIDLPSELNRSEPPGDDSSEFVAANVNGKEYTDSILDAESQCASAV
ncbi:hypothetical protein CPC08DRAFT_125367 [Agrocybe pediades]|nr:hypothetical protein CPC08DRAFT_125367 [Agrocybe pediades]